MADTNQRLQEAITAARSGQLAEARAIAEELTEADPQNAHAWFLRGILSEDEEEQRAYLDKTLALDPEHKAARKRIEQMMPAAGEEAVEEEVEAAGTVEEEADRAADAVEEEADDVGEKAEEAAEAVEEDATMVADSAAFMAAAGLDEVDEMAAEVIAETPSLEEVEEALAAESAEAVDEAAEAVEETVDEATEAVEETFDEAFDATMIAEAPFAEEMAAEDLQVEALFGEAVTAEDEALDEDEGLATVIAAAGFMDEDATPAAEEAAEAVEEAAEEAGELQASDLAAAAAGATILDEADQAWFEEEAGEDLWAKVEAEAVPDWLIEDTVSEQEAKRTEEALEETVTVAEGEVTREQELPDWLLDEPDEDWTEAVESTEVYDEAPEAVAAAATAGALMADEELAPPAEEEADFAAAPKKRSSNRGLEILLVLLIIVAILLVVAIGYFLWNPPNF